jgi:hypothetical protein
MNKNTLIMTLVVGVMASIAFILIQPLFGMSTLTSRHASAYVTLGGYNPTSALVLSWVVHVGVSLCYAFLSNLIFIFNSSLSVNLIQIAVLGWITTLIATPANEWVVKLVEDIFASLTYNGQSSSLAVRWDVFASYDQLIVIDNGQISVQY